MTSGLIKGTTMREGEAHKGGHADGVFKRPMQNTYHPYSNNWHDYNAGYLKGHAENIDTGALKRGGE